MAALNHRALGGHPVFHLVRFLAVVAFRLARDGLLLGGGYPDGARLDSLQDAYLSALGCFDLSEVLCLKLQHLQAMPDSLRAIENLRLRRDVALRAFHRVFLGETLEACHPDLRGVGGARVGHPGLMAAG